MRAPLSSWISAAITRAPSLTKRSTVPRPIPLAAPVTTATLPSRRSAIFLPPKIAFVDHREAPPYTAIYGSCRSRRTLAGAHPLPFGDARRRRRDDDCGECAEGTGLRLPAVAPSGAGQRGH